jgi:hypothetical protein
MNQGEENMDAGTDFANFYIDRVLNEVVEGVKSRIMLEAKLQFLETTAGRLIEDNRALQATIEELNAKLARKQSKGKSTNLEDTVEGIV